MPECTWWTIGSHQTPPSRARSTTALTPIIGLSRTVVRIRERWPCSAIPPAGNIAVAVTAAARDQGLAVPVRIALISPLADLTFSGVSIEERKHLDPLVTRAILESTVINYLAGADPRDPRCSAIFADMHDFPPMLIQVGENEILYDDVTRIRDGASAAGVNVAFES
jgi:acetyl esterase/lipase